MDANMQQELLNSFLEQLISARDVTTQRNPPQQQQPQPQLEISTNIEEECKNCINNQQQQQNETISIVNETIPVDPSSNSNLNIRHTSDLLDSLQKALTVSNNKNEINKNVDNELNVCDKFKVHIVIESALHLPSRKKCKSKRSKTKNPKHNEEILPSTYVTFKGLTDDVIVTPVVPKTTSPKWDYRSDVYLPTELLVNNQKRLIFKVWRKANGPNLQPNFQTDIVLGFAALDLTVLISGLPNVQGWFNIVDFSSKCNGQIKIHVNPLENLSKFTNYKRLFSPEKEKKSETNISQQRSIELRTAASEDTVPSDSLSRALKRKFTELDEITQRLRQRLCAVTNDDFDEGPRDLSDDEFERDLNTLCDDDDSVIEQSLPLNVDTQGPSCSNQCGAESARSNTTSILSAINAAQQIANYELKRIPSDDNASSISVDSAPKKLDEHLNEGKLKIDALLEKLTLLTGEAQQEAPQQKTNLSFTSRYVSGCSDSNQSMIVNSNQLFPDITFPNPESKKTTIDTDYIFNPVLFQEIFTNTINPTTPSPLIDVETTERIADSASTSTTSTTRNSSHVDLLTVTSSSSSSTSLSSSNITRQAPDGAGQMPNESQP